MMTANKYRPTTVPAFLLVALLTPALPVEAQKSDGKAEGVPDIAQLVGDWSGDSICQVFPSACHDEKVLYRITKPEDESAKVRIAGFKIVDGHPILMGSGNWDYDRAKGILIWSTPQGTWKLVVQGENMYGTLTTPDKRVFRRVKLKKEK